MTRLLLTTMALIGAQWLLARLWRSEPVEEWVKAGGYERVGAALGDFTTAIGRVSLAAQRAAFEVEHFGQAISAAQPASQGRIVIELAYPADVALEAALDGLRAALVGEAEPVRTTISLSNFESYLTPADVRELTAYPPDPDEAAYPPEVATPWADASAGDIMRDLTESLTRARQPGPAFVMPPVGWWSPFDYYGNDPNQAPHGTDGGTPMTLEELLEVDRRLDDIDRRLEGE